jgi:hypothetical protein
MAIERRKTVFPEDDAVACAEVNMVVSVISEGATARRRRRDPFMQYKREASTGESLQSPLHVCKSGMPDNQTGRTAEGLQAVGGPNSTDEGMNT